VALIDNHYTFHGVAATYTPLGGSAASVTVIVDEDFNRLPEGQSRRHEAEISVRISEVPARPVYRSTFVVADGAGDNQTWTVVSDGVKELSEFQDIGGEWVCKCTRDERPVL